MTRNVPALLLALGFLTCISFVAALQPGNPNPTTNHFSISGSSGSLGVLPVLPPAPSSPAPKNNIPVSTHLQPISPLKYLPSFQPSQEIRDTGNATGTTTQNISPLNATLEVSEEFAPNQVIVKYRTSMSVSQAGMQSQIASMNSQMGATVTQDFTSEGLPGMQLVNLSGLSVSEAVKRYENSPIVEFAEPNYILHIIDEASNGSATLIPSPSVQSRIIVPAPIVQGDNAPVRSTTLRLSPVIEPSPDIIKQEGRIRYTTPTSVTTGMPTLSPVLQTEGPSISEVSTQDVSPNDLVSSLWGLHNTGQSILGVTGTADADIDAPAAWAMNTGSSSTIIAVIDTGVDYSHPDLANNMWTNSGENPSDGIDNDNNGYIDDYRGWNFYSDTNNPMDDHSHGTHCAGTIAAVGNNGIGVVGVCWTAKIMPLKFLGASGSGYTSDAVSAILYANRMGAHVLSNSWGGGGYSSSLKTAIDNSPAVVVCAAGNEASNTDLYPSYPGAYTSNTIISVAATNNQDNLASFSNYGAVSVDVGAPGVSTYSTTPSNTYGYKSGTSMATPHVSGLAGLIKSTNPALTNLQIKTVILGTTDAKSSLTGKCVTGGRINAQRAVSQVYVPPLQAKFYGIPGTTVFPLTIQFKDASIGTPVSWSWNFGDGNTSTQQNPTHIYYTPGSYNVTLAIQN